MSRFKQNQTKTTTFGLEAVVYVNMSKFSFYLLQFLPQSNSVILTRSTRWSMWSPCLLTGCPAGHNYSTDRGNPIYRDTVYAGLAVGGALAIVFSGDCPPWNYDEYLNGSVVLELSDIYSPMLCSLECFNSSVCAAWSLDLDAGKCRITSAMSDATTPRVNGTNWMWAPRCDSGE